MKDIAVKVDGTTTLPADKFNSMVDELKNSILDTGQALEGVISSDKQTQIAMAIYASAGIFYTDSGSANAYALNVIGSKQSPHAYQDGMIARFRPTNANTGASTVNVNSLGIKSIVYQDGATALAGGSFVTTHDALIRYSLAIDKFILLNNNLNDLLDIDISGAVAGSIIQLNASGIWEAVSGSAWQEGYIKGFICEKASGDTDHDITVSAGKARDALDTFNINSSSAITKQIDANWADGTNNGGFPSSIILTADTWYHFFVISKSDGTENAGFDSSLTATNLLDGSNAGGAGYTKYRRVASVLTDASSNILQGSWHQISGGGVIFKYTDYISDIAGTALQLTYTNTAVSVPNLGIPISFFGRCYVGEGSGAGNFFLRGDNDDGLKVVGRSTSGTSYGVFEYLSKSDSTIDWKREDGSSGILHGIDTKSYTDNRI